MQQPRQKHGAIRILEDGAIRNTGPFHGVKHLCCLPSKEGRHSATHRFSVFKPTKVCLLSNRLRNPEFDRIFSTHPSEFLNVVKCVSLAHHPRDLAAKLGQLVDLEESRGNGGWVVEGQSCTPARVWKSPPLGAAISTGVRKPPLGVAISTVFGVTRMSPGLLQHPKLQALQNTAASRYKWMMATREVMYCCDYHELMPANKADQRLKRRAKYALDKMQPRGQPTFEKIMDRLFLAHFRAAEPVEDDVDCAAEREVTNCSASTSVYSVDVAWLMEHSLVTPCSAITTSAGAAHHRSALNCF